MTVRHLLLGVWIVFAATGCGSCDDEATDAAADAGVMSTPDAARLPDGAIATVDRPLITPEAVDPVIREVGAVDELPDRLVVSFARPIIDDGPRPVGGDTVLQIEPSVAGTTNFSSNSSLTFTPREGFANGETYTVTLSSVESMDGTLEPAQPWSYTFETPEFRFAGMSEATSEPGSNTITTELYFTGPVKPDDLAGRATWSVGGYEVGSRYSVSYQQGSSSNAIRAFISVRGEEGYSIAFELADGLPNASATASAEAASATTTLSFGRTAALFDLTVDEGSNGFYVSTACKDEAAPGGTRYYYSRSQRRSYRVSRRCLPTAESAEKHIEINPSVDFTVSPGQHGFSLQGNFKRGSYTIRIAPGLRTIDGGLVRAGLEQSVNIPARTPKLEFANKGRYLPRSAWSEIPLQHMNVRDMEVVVRHVPERNMIFWMSAEDEDFGPRVAKVVARDQLLLEGVEDTTKTSRIDVERLVPDAAPGVYEVEVRALGQSDSVRLLLTDMNLIVKRSEPRPEADWAEEAFAWVVDMETTKPMEGVEIKAIRPSGDVVGTCKTSDAGGCRLSMPHDEVDPNAPFAFVASKGDDITYLKYDELRVEPPGDVSGEPYLAEARYRAAIYSDRDLYRPAETAHIVAIVRHEESYKAPRAGLPVEMTLRDPRGNVLRTRVLRTNEAGVVTHDERFGDFASTGGYEVEFKVGKRVVGDYDFNVEEFVPERMRVEAKPTRDDFMMDEQAQFRVDAEYLFGGSAEGSMVEVTCRQEPAKFAPKGRDDFVFGPAVELARSTLDLGQVEVELDAQGEAMTECPKSTQDDAMAGPSRVFAIAAVFEAGSGRSTTDTASAMSHPEKYYVGLKSGTEKVSEGTRFETEGVVVDWKGELATDVKSVKIDLIRLEYEYYWYRDDDSASSWGTNLRPVVEGTLDVPVKNGRFEVDAMPKGRSQGYVVRAYHGRSVTDLKLEGSRTRYWWRESRRTTDRTPRPSRPTQLVISGPEAIEVGKSQGFEFEIPFKGRLLVTVETHRVITHEWHEVEPGTFEWDFMLGKFDPTVYVSGLLVKDPHLDSKEAFLPDRAYGVTKVRVKPTQMMHKLAIEAPKEVRPNSSFDVELDLGGPRDEPTFVTVAAVDEGILSLTDMASPDPTKQIFAERALGVTTYETIGWAIQSDPSGVSSKTGGGAYAEEAASGDLDRPMPIEPVALWSGLVKVGKNGKARVSFDVPTYRGALRVMAVSSDSGKTGSAETRVTVRDPLVLQTTLPRFMSGGDTIEIPVFVTNMTGKSGTVEVSLAATEQALPGMTGFSSDAPIVSIRGKATRRVSVDRGASETVVFSVQANKQAGVANFRVDASLGDVTSFDEGIVPFRPNGPHERQVKQVTLTRGVNDLSSELEGWVPTSERSTIWVTATPHGKAFDHLKHLIRYPYGCIEQTTSSTRPLLYIADLVQLTDPASVAQDGGIAKMVQFGIERALSMQTPSGGFGYWPGNNSPWPWATAYATHMLLDAKSQGFEVPQKRIDSALAYMEKEIGTTRGDRYGRRDANGYMSYVLAIAGRGSKAKIQNLIDQQPKNLSGRQLERDYMLKAALYLAGDRRYASELESIDFDAIQGERDSRWSYYSPRRHRAFIFNVYQDTFDGGDRADELAAYIGRDLASQPARRYTTQELMWGITGLGKWTAENAGSFTPPTLSLNGKRIKPTVAPKSSSDRSWSIARASEYPSVKVEIADADRKVFAIISSEGVRKGSEPRAGGNGLSISREFYNYEGNAIEPDDHDLGDLIFVELKVKNTSSKKLDNLALVDRFAGGFEVENPRLGRGTLPDWVDEDTIWPVDHMNVRDDRIEAFGSLERGEERTFVYAVRAVSAGEFFAPPPTIEGMYEPDLWGATLPARVTVNGPWDGLID